MRHLPVLLIMLAIAGCSPPSGPLIRIVNADSVTLDRVMIDAGGSSYALGRLLPGTAGQVRPSPAPDSAITVRHHVGGPFDVAGPYAGGGVVEIRLFADSAVAVPRSR